MAGLSQDQTHNPVKMVKTVSLILIRVLRQATVEAVVQRRLQTAAEISVTESTAQIIRGTVEGVRDHQVVLAQAV